jgi:uncharacterized protein (TIGR02118 family)
MLKFAVVLFKRPDISVERFRVYLRTVHGPLAEQIPGLRKYVQNHVAEDPKRKPPGWHGIVELYFDDWEAMEAGWASPEGERATDDLAEFADLIRTTWSVVEEIVIRESCL